MVEKWLQNNRINPFFTPTGVRNSSTSRSPNNKPALSLFQPVKPLVHRHPQPMKRPFQGGPARYGTPAQLFKDSDRDGVANVFDCQPYNKRKQDNGIFAHTFPQRIAGAQGGYANMLALQEQERANKEYQQQYKDALDLQNKQLAESQRLSTPVVTYSAPTTSSKYSKIDLDTGTTSDTSGFYSTPKGARLSGAYDKSAGGFVTTSGQVYKTTNSSFIPSANTKSAASSLKTTPSYTTKVKK